MPTTARILALPLVALVVTGCATLPQSTEPEVETTTTTPVGATVPAPSSTSLSQETRAEAGVPEDPEETRLRPVIDLAIADLATRLGVDPGEAEVVSVYPALSPATGSDCPGPDTDRDRAAGEVWVIELGVGGEVYRYHAGGEDQSPIPCQAGDPPTPAPSPPSEDAPLFADPKPADELVPPPGYDE